jgi:hypothetical protein
MSVTREYRDHAYDWSMIVIRCLLTSNWIPTLNRRKVSAEKMTLHADLPQSGKTSELVCHCQEALRSSNRAFTVLHVFPICQCKICTSVLQRGPRHAPARSYFLLFLIRDLAHSTLYIASHHQTNLCPQSMRR